MERGAWSVERGAWSVERGAWSVKRGAWSVERGAWSEKRGGFNAPRSTRHDSAWRDERTGTREKPFTGSDSLDCLFSLHTICGLWTNSGMQLLEDPQFGDITFDPETKRKSRAFLLWNHDSDRSWPPSGANAAVGYVHHPIA